jgi:hypothetical protein
MEQRKERTLLNKIYRGNNGKGRSRGRPKKTWRMI